MHDAVFEIPDYYEFLEFSVCGCVAAGYSDTQKKIIVVERGSGRKREIDVSAHLYMDKQYHNLFRIEKKQVYACLFHCADVEFHVQVNMRGKKWKVHTEFTDQFTDMTISNEGRVVVLQSHELGQLKYTFKEDNCLVTTLCTPPPSMCSEEPMLMLSHPAGKYCYIKTLGKLFIPKTQTQITMPFKTPFAYMEWIDDVHDVCFVRVACASIIDKRRW